MSIQQEGEGKRLDLGLATAEIFFTTYGNSDPLTKRYVIIYSHENQRDPPQGGWELQTAAAESLKQNHGPIEVITYIHGQEFDSGNDDFVAHYKYNISTTQEVHIHDYSPYNEQGNVLGSFASDYCLKLENIETWNDDEEYLVDELYFTSRRETGFVVEVEITGGIKDRPLSEYKNFKCRAIGSHEIALTVEMVPLAEDPTKFSCTFPGDDNFYSLKFVEMWFSVDGEEENFKPLYSDCFGCFERQSIIFIELFMDDVHYIPNRNDDYRCLDCYYGDCDEEELTCTCDEGYGGFGCSRPICDPACPSGKVCIAPDHCVCDFGYYGEKCDKKVCGGIIPENPDCADNLYCDINGKCKCLPQYFGTDWDSFMGHYFHTCYDVGQPNCENFACQHGETLSCAEYDDGCWGGDYEQENGEYDDSKKGECVHKEGELFSYCECKAGWQYLDCSVPTEIETGGTLSKTVSFKIVLLILLILYIC